jgi:hypothetical protein
MPTRVCIVGVISATMALLIAPGARAVLVPGYSPSPDWSGYVAGEKGVSMNHVSARWTVPGASCTTVATAFSEVSVWVGLGDSTGIEQIGTDTSCDTDKHKGAFGSAWWELYPSPSHVVDEPVAAGDRMQASVSVTGPAVMLALADATERWSFVRRTTARSVDETSADWIVEDPALNCCQSFPFADFSPVSFTDAQARSTTGRSGTISDDAWAATKFGLILGKPRRLLAWPSPLHAAGSAFTVARTDRSPPPEPPPPPV